MLKSLFALALIAVFASFAVQSLYAAMLMYWWFGLFRPHEWMWWDLSAYRLPLVAAALFIIPSILSGRLPYVKNSLAVLMLLWLALTLLSQTLVGCVNWVTPMTFKHIGMLVAVVLLSVQLIKSRNGLLGLIFTASFSYAFFTSKAGILAAASGSVLYDYSIGGGSFTGSNAAAMGAGISLYLLVFVVQTLRHPLASGEFPKLLGSPFIRKACSNVLLIVLLGSAYFVVATQSRGSALALICGTALWMLLHQRKVLVLIVSGVLATSSIAFVGLPDSYTDRLSSAFVEEEELDNSAASRPHFWKIARKMADSYPLGVGMGCYPAYYGAFDDSGGQFGDYRSVHSSHFSIVAELGYGGFCLWVCMLLLMYKKLFAIRKTHRPHVSDTYVSWFYFYLANALIASQTIFVLGGSFYEMAYNDYTWLIFGLTILAEKLQSEQPSHSAIEASGTPQSKHTPPVHRS